MSGYNVTTKPLVVLARVHYNTDGELQAVNVGLEGVGAVMAYASGSGGDTPGDLFDHALERLIAQSLTLVRTPVPDAPEVLP